MTALSPRRTFSGTALKTIACITMLVDHIGASCIEAGILTPGLDAGTLSQDTLSAYPLYRLDMVLRFTGRLAFPLFCFLLVEGFVHTHNVKGYLGRLVLFGLLSEVPFDLAFFRTPFDPSAQNVYWTLALGVLAMAKRRKRTRKFRAESPDRKRRNRAGYNLAGMSGYGACRRILGNRTRRRAFREIRRRRRKRRRKTSV